MTKMLRNQYHVQSDKKPAD